MKRVIDVFGALVGLVLFSPVLAIFMFLIWREDKYSPIYVAKRVGKSGREFPMVKLRSMTVNADRTGIDSTSSLDARITRVGHVVRKLKLDELMQLWNVLFGHMSLVGPRPNVKRETDLYTNEEKQLLEIKPGITDFASIVFSDEGDILAAKLDPDIAYHQLIRPGKSKLGLFYIENQSISLDLFLIVMTVLSLFLKRFCLTALERRVRALGGGDELASIVLRVDPLKPSPPPGASNIVTSREGVVT